MAESATVALEAYSRWCRRTSSTVPGFVFQLSKDRFVPRTPTRSGYATTNYGVTNIKIIFPSATRAKFGGFVSAQEKGPDFFSLSRTRAEMGQDKLRSPSRGLRIRSVVLPREMTRGLSTPPRALRGPRFASRRISDRKCRSGSAGDTYIRLTSRITSCRVGQRADYGNASPRSRTLVALARVAIKKPRPRLLAL